MNVKKFGYQMIFFLLSITFIGCSADTATEETKKAVDKVQGGTLNIAFNAQPPNLDPHTTTDVGTRDISQNIFEPLVTLTTGLEVAPMLAESFEVSEDGTTITFHLRKGIEFHNGAEMKADDVIASMERWQELSSQAQTYLEGTKYEAVDEYTVIANIDDPTTLDIFILADMTQFAAIMPQEIVENAGSEGVTEYIGTGPFRFEEWRQDQYIHLSKFDDYQSRSEQPDGLAGAKEVTVDDVYYHIVTDPSTRVAGIQSGEYDIANSIPQDSAEMLDVDPNVKNSVYANSFPALIFNKRAGFFSDQSARQAANNAIDVEEMLIAAYGSEQFYVKDHALVKKEQTNWYSDTGSNEYNAYDPELAKRLLDEAGYDGEEVVILTSRERADEYNLAVVVQQQLEAVGMNVTLQVSDWGTVLERREDESAWDIFFTAFAFRPIPTQYLFLNPEWFGWTNSEELARLSEQILYADSQEEAQKFSAEFHQQFWEYLPVIKPGNKTEIISIRESVDGLQYITGPIIWNVTVDD